MPNREINRRVVLNGSQFVWDPLAVTFISVVGLTNDTDKLSINYLASQLRRNGLLTKAHCIYPIIGGTATTHKYNLIDTSLYQITWVNSPTHSSLGVQFNGTSNYGRTGFIPSNVMSINNTALSVYSRTDLNNNGVAIGATVSATQQLRIQTRNGGNLVSPHYSATNQLSVAVADSLRLTTVTKTAANSLKAFKAGAQVGPTQTLCAGSLPNIELYLGSGNSGGVAANFWGGQVCFYGIFSGLTDAECTILDSIIETYQA